MKKNYDKTEIFQSEVLPLLEQLKAVCTAHDLPIACIVAYASVDVDESTIRHESSAMSGGKPDRMPKSMATLVTLLRDAELFDMGMNIVDEAFKMMKEKCCS